jgi:GH25 family lysozyme M1 (1,4-beta-N-acetylmuramidase)
MSVKRGIDISAHNGDINLFALKSQIDFVIIRVGFGTSGTLDKKFKRNADLCKSLGIPFGFYWYSYALNTTGAEKEAAACLKAIEPYKDSYTMGV